MDQAHLEGNSKFGSMFLWSGCICQVLWAYNSFIMQTELTFSDFVPMFIYGALIIAGLAVTESRPKDRRRLNPGDHNDVESATSEGKTCRLMVVGSLAPVQNVLIGLGPSVLVAHPATVADALQSLATMSAEDTPEILVLPWWLPILKSSEVIKTLKSDPIFSPIHVLVWGDNIPTQEIRVLYDAGASCVVPMPLQSNLIPLLRELCDKAPRSKFVPRTAG